MRRTASIRSFQTWPSLQDKRRHVSEIDKILQEDEARPIVYHTRAATCMQPELRGLSVMVNSQYNGWRMEDVWLDQ